jgi:FxsC-like protein
VTTWFFISYERTDDQREEEVRVFFEDLKRQVRAQVPHDRDDLIGALDQTMEPGMRWPSELSRRLGQARTFIALTEPNYFTREFCGKEWELFEQRCRDHQRQTGDEELPPLIIVVPWAFPKSRRIPDFASHIHFTFNLDKVNEAERPFVREFFAHGFRHVFVRRKGTHLGAYESIVRILAEQVIKGAERAPLALKSETAPLSEVPSRFAQAPREQNDNRRTNAVSQRAAVALLAGTLDQMRFIDAPPQRYERDVVRWRPFAPDSPQSAYRIAAAEAATLDLDAYWIEPSNDLVSKLASAQDRRDVTVVIVDPWAVQERDLACALRAFDEVNNLQYCIIIVAWHSHDVDQIDLRDKLRALLAQHLPNKQMLRHPYYQDLEIPLASESGLREAIDSGLRYLREKVAGQLGPARPTPGASPLPQVGATWRAT